MGNAQGSGSQLVTADAVIGASGKATRVYSIHVISTGGGGAVVSLRNGTTASGTIYVTEEGTTSKGKTVAYGDTGLFFPGGCFADVDANTTSVLVEFSQ